MTVDMMCQEGQFVVDNIAYYKEGSLATDSTAEGDWKRRGIYMGPQVRPFYFDRSPCQTLLTFFLLPYLSAHIDESDGIKQIEIEGEPFSVMICSYWKDLYGYEKPGKCQCPEQRGREQW